MFQNADHQAVVLLKSHDTSLQILIGARLRPVEDIPAGSGRQNVYVEPDGAPISFAERVYGIDLTNIICGPLYK